MASYHDDLILSKVATGIRRKVNELGLKQVTIQTVRNYAKNLTRCEVKFANRNDLHLCCLALDLNNFSIEVTDKMLIIT